MSATSINDSLLISLRADPSSWADRVSYAPTDPSDPESDPHLTPRHVVLLSLHAHHHPTPVATDENLLLYLIDEETLYHQRADHYRSALSLAAYLLARLRRPEHLWAVWAARETNYDALKSVDSHYMYYAAGSIQGAREYVERSEAADIVGAAEKGRGREGWWKAVVEEDYEGDTNEAVKGIRKMVLERVAHDEKHGVTDEKVIAFVDDSWRSQTDRWAESLVPEEYVA
ncbi:hypothetical protein FA95DRAFT_56213 [Auriscalpium vulgare]|uniref:Uncharacterized protein n=1 Tax=Auriscalpium vulgare TaxID=40419 RepID=A0ACB8S746_9AGAM|nr:hypothetical protein FA95DRAFT_56213 [Auriscalpium vulgare]